MFSDVFARRNIGFVVGGTPNEALDAIVSSVNSSDFKTKWIIVHHLLEKELRLGRHDDRMVSMLLQSVNFICTPEAPTPERCDAELDPALRTVFSVIGLLVVVLLLLFCMVPTIAAAARVATISEASDDLPQTSLPVPPVCSPACLAQHPPGSTPQPVAEVSAEVHPTPELPICTCNTEIFV